MKLFQKILKWACLILFLAMVGLGIGMTGGVTIPRSTRKENPIEIVVSEKDEKENDFRSIDEDLLE